MAELTGESKEDKLLLARLADKHQQCEQRQYPVCSDFLDARQQALAAAHFGRHCTYAFWGGFAEAERRLMVFLPDYLDFADWQQQDAVSALAVLRAAPSARQSNLTHRDYLGALLALGINRSKLGDLLVQPDYADIIILPELADYLLLNFERAGRCTLQLELLPATVLQNVQPRTETLRLNVSSLRLDAVAAAAFGVSRSKAAAAAIAGLLAVNGLTLLKPDYALDEGMKIAWRGKGLVRLAEIGSKTRKERIWLQIEKYI